MNVKGLSTMISGVTSTGGQNKEINGALTVLNKLNT